jgi:radical SAM superfamily enzyme YgiQ (UPF0313 family)
VKLALIKPNIGRREHSLYVDEGRMEPLTLGVIAALTPPDIDIKLYDDRCETIPYDEPTDLAVITVESFTARRAYEISAEYKKRNIPVILGGMHVQLMPEEASEHADSIFLGDAEALWGTVVKDVQNGRLQKVYKGTFTLPQNHSYPRRDLYQGKGYLPISLMQFSRGCKYGCTFCATSIFFNQQQFTRDLDDVIGEIKSQNRKLIFFVDDNIVSDFDLAKDLFKALIPLKIKWVSQASINMVQDDELMTLMVKSGCLGHVVGFESLNIKNLNSMNKASYLAANFHNYDQPIKLLKNYGLQTWAAFTLGYDEDTRESIQATLEFAIRHKFAFAAFNILMPYPGTPFYDQLNREKRLLYNGQWWLHDQYRFNHAAFVPKHMTPEELTEACYRARTRFNSPSSIFYRAFDLKTNMRSLYRLLTYCAYNPLFRKEVHKKQGMKFGLH